MEYNLCFWFRFLKYSCPMVYINFNTRIYMIFHSRSLPCQILQPIFIDDAFTCLYYSYNLYAGKDCESIYTYYNCRYHLIQLYSKHCSYQTIIKLFNMLLLYLCNKNTLFSVTYFACVTPRTTFAGGAKLIFESTKTSVGIVSSSSI